MIKLQKDHIGTVRESWSFAAIQMPKKGIAEYLSTLHFNHLCVYLKIKWVMVATSVPGLRGRITSRMKLWYATVILGKVSPLTFQTHHDWVMVEHV